MVTYKDIPRCFTEAQFADWKSLARLSPDPVTICEDCTKQYMAKMMRAGACNTEGWQALKFGGRPARIKGQERCD